MPKYKLFNASFQELMPVMGRVNTIFADPPDNIKLGYDKCTDNMDAGEYIDFLDNLISACIKKARTTFISFNAKWFTDVAALMHAYQLTYDIEVRLLIQGFTFGQHNTSDLSNDFRPIIRIRKPGALLYPNNVRVESKRMKLGDKRANPAGRVPGDVWRSDFLEYSRVVGNSKQRRKWCPTQLHEGLVEDCLLLTTPQGGLVLDPFCGTGTTLRVCMANGWSCTTMDISKSYCEKVAEEQGLPEVADGIWTLDKYPA